MLKLMERSPIADLHALSDPQSVQDNSLLADAQQATAQILNQCALLDLSTLSRVGFRGADSAAFLQNQGYQLPATANTALLQSSGEWLARLSATEYLLLASLQDFGAHVAQLEQGWQMDASRNYLLPRQDSHAWLQIRGQAVPALMAKLCAVDLSSNAFAYGAIAQTSVARINAIVINVGEDVPVFDLLCDRASSVYLWQVLVDAMAEFDGRVLGVKALL